MATFIIDSDNNIVAHSAPPPIVEGQQRFSNEKELFQLAQAWPGSRLIEIWNSFAGAAPFDDLKPVKKFTSRKSAIGRMWKAVSRLAAQATAVANQTKPRKRSQRRQSSDASNKKAQVIGLLRRPKGATLDEIIGQTGWQKHTVRGFVSLLGSKGGENIESSKNSSGERCYRIKR